MLCTAIFLNELTKKHYGAIKMLASLSQLKTRDTTTKNINLNYGVDTKSFELAQPFHSKNSEKFQNLGACLKESASASFLDKIGPSPERCHSMPTSESSQAKEYSSPGE